MSLPNMHPLQRSMRDNSIELKGGDMSMANVMSNNFVSKSSVRSMRWANGADNSKEQSKVAERYHISRKIRAPGSRFFVSNSSHFQSNSNLADLSPQKNKDINFEESNIRPIQCVLELPTVQIINETRTNAKPKIPNIELNSNNLNARTGFSSKLLRIRPALNMIIRNQQPAVKLNFVALNNNVAALSENVQPIQSSQFKAQELKATSISSRRNLALNSTSNSRTTSEFFKVKNRMDIKKYLYHILNSPKRVDKKMTIVKPTSKPKNFMMNSSAPLVVGKIGHKSTLKSVEFPTMLMCQGIFGPFLLIFGGLSSFIHSDFIVYNFTDQTFLLKNFSKYVDLSRFGHSMDQIGNTVYIFGGTNSFQGYINRNLNINFSNLNPEFFGLNLETWKVHEIKPPNFCQPSLRKFHATFVLDNTYLFVFGGIRTGDKFAKDVWIFVVEDENWHEFKVSSEFYDLELMDGVAHHKILCMSSNILTLKTDKIYEETQKGATETPRRNIYLFKSDKKHITLDVYLFGGINGNNEIIDNDLWQMCMKNKHFYFKKVPVVEGYKPEKRHSHSMTKINNDSFVIFGGRGRDNSFLNSMDCFSFSSKSWTKLELVNNEWSGDISSHAVAAYESVIFIFGGISQMGFLEPNVYYCGFS